MASVSIEDFGRCLKDSEYLATFRLTLLELQDGPENKRSFLTPDYLLTSKIETARFDFAVNCLKSSRPQEFFRGLMQIRSIAQSMSVKPLLLVPYLSQELIDV